MPQQQTEPLVVPEDSWLGSPESISSMKHGGEYTQLDWMLIRKGYTEYAVECMTQEQQLSNLEKFYIINDLDIRKIQEQEAAGNYFLMSLYVNTMVFDKEAL